MTSTFARLALGSTAMTLILAVAAPSHAQTGAGAASPTDQVEEVVVTGSRIARRDFAAQSPIVTVTEAAIEANASYTVEGVLNQLPQFTGASGAQTNSNGGRALANLRGLGPRRALVLLDGRRLQPSQTTGGVDLNTIPDSLLGSVEVITGGASAVYGSDAVAGVVNFRLKKDFEGVEAAVRYNQTDVGKGETVLTSLTLGGNFADDRGNAVLALSYMDRGPVTFDQSATLSRGQLSTTLPDGVYRITASNLPTQAAVNAVFARYGIAPGAVPRSNQLGFNADGTLFSPATPVSNYRGPSNDISGVANGAVTFSTSAYRYLQLPLQRYNLFTRVNYEVSESVNVYTQAYYTKYTSRTQIAPPVAGGTGVAPLLVPYNNPFVSADFAQILASRPNPTAPFTMTKRMLETGTRNTENQYEVWQALTGVTLQLPVRDWSADAYASYGRFDYRTSEAGTPSLPALIQLLNAPDGGRSLCAGGYNFFGPQTISQACVDFLERNPTDRTEIVQKVAELTVQGGLFQLPAGELRFAAGAGYRYNSFDFLPDLDNQLGLIVNGGNGVDPSGGSSEVTELYGELLVPVIKAAPFVQALNLGLGARVSDYAGLGSVSTYKADFDWTVVDGLMLRGGLSRAIRAPSIGELFLAQSGGATNLGNPGPVPGGDPCDVRSGYRAAGYADAARIRTLCLAQNVPAAVIDNFRATNVMIAHQSRGNPDLEPETADTFSIGAVWRPALPWSRLVASVDYFNIELQGAVGTVTTVLAVSKCFNADGTNPSFDPTNYYCSLIAREPTSGVIDQVQNPLLNLGGYRTSGVDVQVDWGFELESLGLSPAWGRLDFNMVGAYLLTYEIATLQDAPFVDYAGTVGNNQIDVDSDTHPRWKSALTATWGRDPFQLSLRWRYISSMSNSANVGTASTLRGVKAVSFFDVDARWDVTSRIELSVGAANLLNRDPPEVGNIPNNTSLGTYDAVGRRAYVGLKAKF